MTLIPAYDPSAPLPAAADFYRLRREAIEAIGDTSGSVWTDYNTHDPGISILEALAYAITELTYRTGFSIEDILASAGAAADPRDPYPDQSFYSARRILTVNPVTTADLRRLLADVSAVRNAWVRCDACGCATEFYAWCEDGELVVSHDPAQRKDPNARVTKVEPRGLYQVLLELEADPELGDLNDRKIVRQRTVVDGDGRRHTLTVEVRFPEWGASQGGERARLRDAADLQQVTVDGPNRTLTGSTPVDPAEFRRHWFDVFYVDFAIVLGDGSAVAIENASLRIFGDSTVRAATEPTAVNDWLADEGPDGVVEQYRRKLAVTDAATAAARATLEAHRNLDEDWCCVGLIEITDVAVCADVEVAASADIDRVQAEIWFQLERYLAPPVDFASLDELRSSGAASEAIFNGPELDGGFLTDQVLNATDLREQLRVSDILNILLDIDGVVSVEALRLTAYDGAGRPIPGISDPQWQNGVAVFEAARISAAWLMVLSSERRARLHRRLSQLSFSSGGLPFTPRSDEVDDTLMQLRGQAVRPRLTATELDLPIPAGTPHDLEAYEPVQHGFPAVYGIGPAGLPSTATAERRAQARQLKAYLMVFEQLLRDAYAQLAHTPDLFSLDRSVDRTYFSALLDDAGIVGYDEVVDTARLTSDTLARLVESSAEFDARRNSFLDHLLARFGESFADYALVLTDLEGQARASSELIRDKLAFLRAVPRIEHDRAKAFNRRVAPGDPDNASGLRQRMNLLLGFPDWTIVYRAAADPAGFVHSLAIEELDETMVTFELPAAVGTALDAFLAEKWPAGPPADWSIRGADGRLTLTTTLEGRLVEDELIGPEGLASAQALGAALVERQRAILAEAIVTASHDLEPSGARWRVAVRDRDGARIGTSDQEFATRQTALEFIALLSAWAAHQRSIVVEHLLLRPKFPGDALYPACFDTAEGSGDCGCGCGDEDPYSFRLTYVMPGWTEPFSSNMRMRGYADRTIQEHTPSHLIMKTCWVGNDGYIPDPCEPVADDLADILTGHGEAHAAACECAAKVLDVYQTAFADWFDEHSMLRRPLAELQAMLAPVLAAVDLSATGCLLVTDDAVRAELEAALSAHFAEIVLHGYQFERFEEAWSAWAVADGRIDWSAEHLGAVVQDLVRSGATATMDEDALCTASRAILREFGQAFRDWMDDGLTAGIPFASFRPFDPPVPAACAGVVSATVATQIRDVLRERYTAYSEASYRLSLLVSVLADLRNTYPRATLHDCDEGSDFNPVRLGQTALGSN